VDGGEQLIRGGVQSGPAVERVDSELGEQRGDAVTADDGDGAAASYRRPLTRARGGVPVVCTDPRTAGTARAIVAPSWTTVGPP
jgi:hypothetical protein